MSSYSRAKTTRFPLDSPFVVKRLLAAERTGECSEPESALRVCSDPLSASIWHKQRAHWLQGLTVSHKSQPAAAGQPALPGACGGERALRMPKEAFKLRTAIKTFFRKCDNMYKNK